jgi:hypothetical protein
MIIDIQHEKENSLSIDEIEYTFSLLSGVIPSDLL